MKNVKLIKLGIYIAALVLLIGFIALDCPQVFAYTYVVTAPSYNSAIQAKIDIAQPNDIILIRAGSHYITKPLKIPTYKSKITIVGETGAVLRKAPQPTPSAAIEIWGNENKVDNIDIDGGNLPDAGIIIYGQRNYIVNSKIHNCGNSTAVGGGIVLHNTGYPVCCLNKIEGCKVYYNYQVGISQKGHSDGQIINNQIYENGAEGITIDIRSHNNVITNNWVHLNNTGNRGVGGIGTDASNGNNIQYNTIDYTRYKSGITFQNNVGGCDGVIVKNNRINNNGEWGILEVWTRFKNTNCLFQNNQLLNNVKGTTKIVY